MSRDNRRLYAEKFARGDAAIARHLDCRDARCRLLPVGQDTPIVRHGFRPRTAAARYNVTVLPGSFLAREADGVNPGADFVRIALVAGARRMPRSRAAHRRFLPISL